MTTKIILKEIRPESVGTHRPYSITPQEEKEAGEMVKFIKEKLNECELLKGKDNKARISKELFDYIIDQDVLKNPKLGCNLKFCATVWNKLVEFQYENVPGPNNPKEWVPIAAEKLSFLNRICHTTGKTSVTEWNVIP